MIVRWGRRRERSHSPRYAAVRTTRCLGHDRCRTNPDGGSRTSKAGAGSRLRGYKSPRRRHRPGETPGRPVTAHWGIADPAAVEGTEAEKTLAFRKALNELETRIKLLTSLPIDSLDALTLQTRLREIGGTAAESS